MDFQELCDALQDTGLAAPKVPAALKSAAGHLLGGLGVAAPETPVLQDIVGALHDALRGDGAAPAANPREDGWGVDEACTVFSSAFVSYMRKSSGGLSRQHADSATACATRLADRCLARLSAAGGQPSKDGAQQAKSLRALFRAIAIGAVEAEDSGSDSSDPMAAVEVGRVFDAYAGAYDGSMETLRYSVPSRLSAWLTHMQDGGKGKCQWGTVVDLGCGTGLLGRIARDKCTSLAGCDLSPGMVLAAAQLGIYDELRICDCSSYLDGFPSGTVDLILGGDVIEYIGDVKGLFQKGSAALAPGGCMVVSTEDLESSARHHGLDVQEDCGFYLLPTERYAHRAQYLQETSTAAGLTVERLEPLPCLREEDGHPLKGWLCFLHKAP